MVIFVVFERNSNRHGQVERDQIIICQEEKVIGREIAMTDSVRLQMQKYPENFSKNGTDAIRYPEGTWYM